jgi:hypothetical protein
VDLVGLRKGGTWFKKKNRGQSMQNQLAYMTIFKNTIYSVYTNRRIKESQIYDLFFVE